MSATVGVRRRGIVDGDRNGGSLIEGCLYELGLS